MSNEETETETKINLDSDPKNNKRRRRRIHWTLHIVAELDAYSGETGEADRISIWEQRLLGFEVYLSSHTVV